MMTILEMMIMKMHTGCVWLSIEWSWVVISTVIRPDDDDNDDDDNDDYGDDDDDNDYDGDASMVILPWESA